jgi:hypothetical protein
MLPHCLTSLLGESHWHIPVMKQLISSEFFLFRKVVAYKNLKTMQQI